MTNKDIERLWEAYSHMLRAERVSSNDPRLFLTTRANYIIQVSDEDYKILKPFCYGTEVNEYILNNHIIGTTSQILECSIYTYTTESGEKIYFFCFYDAESFVDSMHRLKPLFNSVCHFHRRTKFSKLLDDITPKRYPYFKDDESTT